jgi:hypothetical protein
MIMGMAAAAFGQALQAAEDVTAQDTPLDAGSSITVTWQASPDEAGGKVRVLAYEVWRATRAAGEYKRLGEVESGNESYEFKDGKAESGVGYFRLPRSGSTGTG